MTLTIGIEGAIFGLRRRDLIKGKIRMAICPICDEKIHQNIAKGALNDPYRSTPGNPGGICYQERVQAG